MRHRHDGLLPCQNLPKPQACTRGKTPLVLQLLLLIVAVQAALAPSVTLSACFAKGLISNTV